MSINLKQLPDGSMGIEGKDLDTGAFVVASTPVNAVTPATAIFYTAPRAMQVQSITYSVETSGTGGACTFVVKKAPSGTALASGTTIHSGTGNVAGTAATNQTITVSTTTGVPALAAGDRLGIIVTGTATSAVGSVSVGMTPL